MIKLKVDERLKKYKLEEICPVCQYLFSFAKKDIFAIVLSPKDCISYISPFIFCPLCEYMIAIEGREEKDDSNKTRKEAKSYFKREDVL